jgi:hypothetical protein
VTRSLALSLVHHPVLDRDGKVVTTAITNLDLHDISRSALTFGAVALYVTHPVAAQRELAERVRNHWTTGSGARRIPDRSRAIELLCVVDSLASACAAHGGGGPVEVWTTGARAGADGVDYVEARIRLRSPGPPVLLVFGTGWGLSDELTPAADCRLMPIESARADGYNHLSVRAAAAIILDRLCGPR